MSEYPKKRDVVARRTVIYVRPKSDMIIFGLREGKVENCGAWLTNLKEWTTYQKRYAWRKEALQ